MNKETEIEKGESNFERRSRDLLRAESESLSGAALSRLNRSRQSALAHLDTGPARGKFAGLLPVSGAVLAGAVVIALWLGTGPSITTDAPGLSEVGIPVTDSSVAADIDVLITDDSLELLEDLDFYNWLQSVPTGPGTA